MNMRIKDLAAHAGINNRFANPKEIWGYDVNVEQLVKLVIEESCRYLNEIDAEIEADCLKDYWELNDDINKSA